MVDESMYQVPGQESNSRYAAGGHRDERPLPANNRRSGQAKMPASRGSQKQQRGNPPGYSGGGPGGANHDFTDPVENLNLIA